LNRQRLEAVSVRVAPTNASSFEIAPLAPFRGEGLGVRGFALWFGWSYDRRFNALLCPKSINKSLDRSHATRGSPPHPPAPSLRSGARGRKSHLLRKLHRGRLVLLILIIQCLACHSVNAQSSEDIYSNEYVRSALEVARECAKPLSKNSEVADAFELLFEFNPQHRHRFVLPRHPNAARANFEQMAKLFESKDSLEAFRQSLEKLAQTLDQLAITKESNQDLESGYRLRWQAAGLRSIVPVTAGRKEPAKPTWTEATAIGTMKLTPKAFVNHPKTLWPAGSYSVALTPNFEIVSQAGARPTEEVAELCEQAFAIWKQIFFSVWADHRTSAPEYARSQDSKFSVTLFRDKAAYEKALKPTERNIGISTGFYDPNRKMALFYWDGQKTMETVVHELVHQFFFEASSQDVALDTDNGPGFWIIEGIALYMESMSTRACGAGILADVGGWDAPRFQAGRYRRLNDQFWSQWDEFRSATGTRFRRGKDIAIWYSQACGLAHLWMDGTPEQRRALVKYVQSVYAGKEEAALLGEMNADERLRTAYDRFLVLGPTAVATRPFYANRKEAVLTRCGVTTKQLLEWPIGFRSSTWLELSFTQVDDELFVGNTDPVEPPWNVRRLVLESTNVTDRSLETLSQMKDLQELDVSNCKVTDTGIAMLRGNKSIKTLWLTNCDISDASIDVLLTISQLESIHLKGTKISPDGWERLLNARPRLKSKSERP